MDAAVLSAPGTPPSYSPSIASSCSGIWEISFAGRRGISQGTGRRALGHLLTVLFVLAATAAAGAAAAGASALHPIRIATATGNVVSDGARFAAYPTSATAVQVIDTKRGRVRTITLPAGCSLVGTGDAYVLAGCAAQSPPLVFSARTGHAAPLAGWEGVQERSVQTGAQVSAQAIGSDWLQLLASTTTIPSTWYLNWHTGQLRDEPISVRQTTDLNASPLVRTLCSPLRRMRRDLQDQAGQYWPFLYQRPWGVATTGQGTYAQHCGERQRLRLQCPAGCPSLQLGGTAVSWATPSEASLLRLGRTRRYSVRIPQSNVSAAAHTRCDLFASSATDRTPAPPAVAIYRARLPHCRR
jgi:hypothetical protein